MVQNNQESRRKYWANRSTVDLFAGNIHSFTCTLHSFACFALFALLGSFACLLAHYHFRAGEKVTGFVLEQQAALNHSAYDSWHPNKTSHGTSFV